MGRFHWYGETFSVVFEKFFDDIHKPGNTRTVGPRGKQTIEFAGPTSWTINRPWNCWLTYNNRKLNPFFAAAEIFWILGGSSDVDWICRFNENMRTFADGDNSNFNAAYGERIRRYEMWPQRIDQVDCVVNRLMEDTDTRRACIGLWHPSLDNRKSKDIACNNMVYFLIRDKKLHTTVTIRSNDLIWGTPYNMLQFQHLAMLVQGEYNSRKIIKDRISRGTHTVQANSLHLYLDEYDKYDDLVARLKESGVALLDQSKCASPIDFKGFDALYKQLNTELEIVEQGGESYFMSKSFDTYWDQLAALPVLYLAKKRGLMDKRQVLNWVDKSMDPLFAWLIADFWGMDINGGW